MTSQAASDSRNATRSATPVASPNRRSVTVSVRLARFLSGKIAVVSWVSGPGVTALTLMPNRVAWPASALTKPAIPGRVVASRPGAE